MRTRTLLFVAWIAVIGLLSWTFLHAFIRESLAQGYSSQSVLVPFIAAYLIWSDRARIFSRLGASVPSGAVLALAGIAIFFGSRMYAGQGLALDGLKLLGVLLAVAGGFVGAYGLAAFRAATFPFVLLLLMMPLPTSFVERIIHWLQTQSTTLSYMLFSALGIPVYRDGFLLHLPKVTIEVAEECSGINSSVALLLTALLVGWETLRTTSRRAVLLLLTIPLSVVKNAVRIVTLTLLAIYVDPSFLTGRLHHEGGFVFFLIALALVYPVWWWLRKSEDKKVSPGPGTGTAEALSQAAGR